jgi:PAS domain S-box-containing protein
MIDKEKTQEEFSRELLELQQSYIALKEKYENGLSQLKQAQEKAAKSEEKFRIAFMTSSDAININRLDDGMYVFINEGFTNITGYSEDDVIGKTSVKLNIWSEQERRKDLVKKLLANGRVENYEAKFQRKDGSILDGVMAASLIEIDGKTHILSETRDITAVKKLDDESIRNKILINTLMNNLEDYIWIKDRDSRFVLINKSHADALGLENPDQVVGKTDRDFYSEEHSRPGYEDEQSIIKTGQPIYLEERLTTDGEPDKWVISNKLPMYDPKGNIIGVFGISKNITDKKNLEDALHLKQSQLEAIINNSPDQIYYKDRDSRFLLCNTPVALLAGCNSEEDMIGKSDFDFHPDNLARQYYEDEQTLMEKGQIILDHEEPILNKQTGELLWNLSSKVPIKDSEGNVIGLAGFNRDITSRKRTELENQILYEITQGITETSNLDELLKLIHHSIGKVVYAENFFVALHNSVTDLFSFPYFVDKFDETPQPVSMGKSTSEYVFRTLKPLLLSQGAYNQLLKQNEVEPHGSESPSWIGIPLQTGSKAIGVMVLQHYEKENVYSENDMKLLMSIGSQVAIAIERKKAEEEILLKNELLQTINAEKDKFFSILAHDLRGPLSAFVAATQIITEEIQTMDLEEVREITDSMKTSATNIYSLLENLLEWSRLKRGTMDFEPVVFNLKSRIEDCVAVLNESAVKKEILIDFSIPDNIDMYADIHMFDTIIRNLVSNALKFTHVDGKVSINAVREKEDAIKINIVDSGIGMTSELKDRLFMINEKTSRKGTAGESSTGLGLLLCKEFVEKHNGKIWVESEVGKGSVFSFIIPEKGML